MGQSTTGTDSSRTEVNPEQLTQSIVDAVADETGMDPTELDPLYHVVDPDALNSLFHPRPGVNSVASAGEVRFAYHGFEVQVTADGRVSLEESADATVRTAD